MLRKVNPKQNIRLKIRKEKGKNYIKGKIKKIRKGRKRCILKKKKMNRTNRITKSFHRRTTKETLPLKSG